MKRTVASSAAAASSGDIFDRSDFWWDNPRPRGRGAEATTDLESRLNPTFSSCFYDEFYFPNSFKSGRENYANTEPRFVINLSLSLSFSISSKWKVLLRFFTAKCHSMTHLGFHFMAT